MVRITLVKSSLEVKDKFIHLHDYNEDWRDYVDLEFRPSPNVLMTRYPTYQAIGALFAKFPQIRFVKNESDVFLSFQ